MPKKVVPNFLEYMGFDALMRKNGFVKMSTLDKQKVIEMSKIDISRPPRKTKVNEDVYIAHMVTGYKVKVRTTISMYPFAVEDSDQGHVIIEDGLGKAVMHFPPFMRTKNFLLNLVQMARVARYIAYHRPLNCECGGKMILKKEGLRKHVFNCEYFGVAIEHSDKIDVFDFIMPMLPTDLKKFLKYYLKRKDYADNRAIEKGCEPGSSQLKRKRHQKK